MKKRTITIVIPAYNESGNIKSCLDAIASQIDMPDAVIVVDNNSTDDTVAIAKRYPFVTILHEHTQGIVFARNAGFNATTTDVIARIDADTIIEHDWVKRLRSFYETETAAITGSCYFYNVPHPQLGRRITNGLLYHFNYFITGYYPLWGSNMALRRADWQKVANKVCLQNDIHEDLDISSHLHAAGVATVFDNDLLAGVLMRRSFSSRKARWDFAMQWPRSLRRHGQLSWIPATLGAVFIYATSWVPRAWVAFDKFRVQLRRWFAYDSR